MAAGARPTGPKEEAKAVCASPSRPSPRPLAVSLSLSLSLPQSLSFTLSLSHSLTHSIPLSLTLSLSLTQSLTHSLTQSIPLSLCLTRSHRLPLSPCLVQCLPIPLSLSASLTPIPSPSPSLALSHSLAIDHSPFNPSRSVHPSSAHPLSHSHTHTVASTLAHAPAGAPTASVSLKACASLMPTRSVSGRGRDRHARCGIGLWHTPTSLPLGPTHAHTGHDTVSQKSLHSCTLCSLADPPSNVTLSTWVDARITRPVGVWVSITHAQTEPFGSPLLCESPLVPFSLHCNAAGSPSSAVLLWLTVLCTCLPYTRLHLSFSILLTWDAHSKDQSALSSKPLLQSCSTPCCISAPHWRMWQGNACNESVPMLYSCLDR